MRDQFLVQKTFPLTRDTDKIKIKSFISKNYMNHAQSHAPQLPWKLEHTKLPRQIICRGFLARDSICYSALYAIARPSVCLSVRPSIRHKGGSVKDG